MVESLELPAEKAIPWVACVIFNLCCCIWMYQAVLDTLFNLEPISSSSILEPAINCVIA